MQCVFTTQGQISFHHHISDPLYPLLRAPFFFFFFFGENGGSAEGERNICVREKHQLVASHTPPQLGTELTTHGPWPGIEPQTWCLPQCSTNRAALAGANRDSDWKHTRIMTNWRLLVLNEINIILPDCLLKWEKFLDEYFGSWKGSSFVMKSLMI